MEDAEFPPNSRQSKREGEPDKKIERVTTVEPIRRKKGLGKRIKGIFFGGDPKATWSFIVQGVLIPAAKDMLVDAVSEGVQKLVRGDSYRKRNAPTAGPQGYISYNRMAPPTTRRDVATSRVTRGKHDFDDIVLADRAEAELVIERMYDIVGQYTTATVADLYELVGIRGTHVDNKWGWSDMRGAGVVRVPGGYLLELPDPQPMAM